jgi:hypothetical protein
MVSLKFLRPCFHPPPFYTPLLKPILSTQEVKDKADLSVFAYLHSPNPRKHTEMEFLDISYTKDLILLLHAIQSSFYWRILKKTILFSGFENPDKKSAKQDNSSLFINNIL